MLLTLPPELHLLISSYLTPPEVQLLRSTCTNFCTLLPEPTSEDLLAIEHSIYNTHLLDLCLSCQRFYPLASTYQFLPNQALAATCQTCGESWDIRRGMGMLAYLEWLRGLQWEADVLRWERAREGLGEGRWGKEYGDRVHERYSKVNYMFWTRNT